MVSEKNKPKRKYYKQLLFTLWELSGSGLAASIAVTEDFSPRNEEDLFIAFMPFKKIAASIWWKTEEMIKEYLECDNHDEKACYERIWLLLMEEYTIFLKECLKVLNFIREKYPSSFAYECLYDTWLEVWEFDGSLESAAEDMGNREDYEKVAIEG